MTTASIAVRRAGRGDWRFIEALGVATVSDSVPPGRSPHMRAVVESFKNLLVAVRDRSHEALIAEKDGEAAGFLLLVFDLPDEVTGQAQAFIAYAAVAPEHRGGGIASKMLTGAEDEARKRGLPYMGLMVTEGNAAALALYESAGYATERRLLCKKL